jgi:hypothetical protein
MLAWTVTLLFVLPHIAGRLLSHTIMPSHWLSWDLANFFAQADLKLQSSQSQPPEYLGLRHVVQLKNAFILLSVPRFEAHWFSSKMLSYCLV